MDPKPCGCKDDQSSDYLFVKATGTDAALCGPVNNPTGIESCPIQEPSYDVSQSDFLLPTELTSANMQVCNGTIYSVNQWLFFLVSKIHLKISGITGNILTLVNQCAVGVIIDTNPEPGFVVHRGDVFSVSGPPPCLSGDANTNIVVEGLSNLEELCVPDMIQASQTAEIHPVGLVMNDTDPAFHKCIRRISGFTINNGSPYFFLLKQKTEAELINFNRLLIQKSTKEVAYIPPYGDWAGLGSGQIYSPYTRKNESEKLVRNNPFVVNEDFLFENADPNDSVNWPTFPDDTDLDKEFILNAFYNDPAWQLHLTEFHVMLRLEFAATSATGDPKVHITANTHHVANYYPHTFPTSLVVTTIIPVQRADMKLSLRASKENVDTKIYYRASIEGFYP